MYIYTYTPVYKIYVNVKYDVCANPINAIAQGMHNKYME